MSSLVRDVLAEYVAGRSDAKRVVKTVAEQFYGEGKGRWERLRPLIDVIERAAPGVVELARTQSAPGFRVGLAERPFPREYEADLRRAASQVLAGLPADESPTVPASPLPVPQSPGLFRRLLGAIQRFFIS